MALMHIKPKTHTLFLPATKLWDHLAKKTAFPLSSDSPPWRQSASSPPGFFFKKNRMLRAHYHLFYDFGTVQKIPPLPSNIEGHYVI